MKDSEVLKLRCPPPFYPRLASRSLLSVALLGCLPSLDAAVCVMRLHGLFFGTPQYAKDLVERLEIHYTPKHGSWLDIAEIELSALGRQCIANNRIPDLPSLRNLLKPWAVARNIAQKGVDWHFTTDDARTRLKHLYPIVKI